MGAIKTRRKPLEDPKKRLVRRRKNGQELGFKRRRLIRPLVGIKAGAFKETAKRGYAIFVFGDDHILLPIFDRTLGVLQGVYETQTGGLISLRFCPGWLKQVLYGSVPGAKSDSVKKDLEKMSEWQDALFVSRIREGVEIDKAVPGSETGIQINPDLGTVHMFIMPWLGRQGIATKLLEKMAKHRGFRQGGELKLVNLYGKFTGVFEKLDLVSHSEERRRQGTPKGRKSSKRKQMLISEKNDMQNWATWEAIDPKTGKIRKYRVRLVWSDSGEVTEYKLNPEKKSK